MKNFSIDEFVTTFKTFCGAYNKNSKIEVFLCKAHLLFCKNKNVTNERYLNIILKAIDKHVNFMPTIGQLNEIRKEIEHKEYEQEKELNEKNKKYLKTKMKIREYFEKANNDVEEKRKRGIEHINLVDMFDRMKRYSQVKINKTKKLSEIIIKKQK